MAIEIIVPRLGWSMEEGTFAEWLIQDGDFVNEELGLAVKGLAGRIGGLGTLCFRVSGEAWRPCGMTGQYALAYQWLCGQVGDALLEPLPSERELQLDDVDLVFQRFLVRQLELGSS